MAKGQLAPTRFEWPRLRLSGVPVFVYHGLANSDKTDAPSRERKYWIQRAQFEDHLKHICCAGPRVGLLRELWDPTDTLDQRTVTVVLTFDDGLASAYDVAYPLLLEAGMRADFFVNTSTVGAQGFLSWSQILEMQRAGMSFQSHSHEHVYLTWLPANELERQLRDSKRMIEDSLGQPVDFLSAPYGDLDGRVVRAARYVGYKAVCSSWSWPARPGASLVGRVVVDCRTTLGDFRRLLTGSPVAYAVRATRGCLMYFPKRLLLRFRPSPPPLGYVPPGGEK